MPYPLSISWGKNISQISTYLIPLVTITRFFIKKKNSQSTIENAGIKKERASAKMQRPRLFIHRKHDRLVSVINNILWSKHIEKQWLRHYAVHSLAKDHRPYSIVVYINTCCIHTICRPPPVRYYNWTNSYTVAQF